MSYKPLSDDEIERWIAFDPKNIGTAMRIATEQCRRANRLAEAVRAVDEDDFLYVEQPQRKELIDALRAYEGREEEP
jgi:hypothetical protein